MCESTAEASLQLVKDIYSRYYFEFELTYGIPLVTFWDRFFGMDSMAFFEWLGANREQGYSDVYEIIKTRYGQKGLNVIGNILLMRVPE